MTKKLPNVFVYVSKKWFLEKIRQMHTPCRPSLFVSIEQHWQILRSSRSWKEFFVTTRKLLRQFTSVLEVTNLLEVTNFMEF